MMVGVYSKRSESKDWQLAIERKCSAVKNSRNTMC